MFYLNRNFYQDLAKSIPIKDYKDIVTEDFEMMTNIVLPLTSKKMKEVMQNRMASYLRYYVEHRLKQFITKFTVKEVTI